MTTALLPPIEKVTKVTHLMAEVERPGGSCCVGRLLFFPRVRTPCGHGAQVIVEGREEKTDGGERNEDPKKPTQKPTTQARRPTPPSCSLPYTLGETCETETSDN